MKILMVCLGNICRSPLAEGILQSKLKNKSGEFIIDSAGTDAFHAGQAPDKRAISVAKKYGIDISGLRARKFVMEDFNRFDYIFAMDKSNFKDLSLLAQNTEDQAKLHLFLDYSGNKTIIEVPDPWYGNENDFEYVYGLLNEACENAANKLIKTTNKDLHSS